MTHPTHQKKVKKISDLLKNYHQKKEIKKIRFSHGSTNSTRVQDKSDSYIIDISSFKEILQIDRVKKTAIVEPNVPMDQLVKKCLHYNLIPKVVMEFPGITCGGGINGDALEASSYKYGQFNDTCLEYECILADGSIKTANKDENLDLFYGISGSYGSLALVSSIKLSLIQAKPFILVNFLPIDSEKTVLKINELIQLNKYDYIDAIIFSNRKAVIITGVLIKNDSAPVVTFTKAHDEWFYLYAQQAMENKSAQKIKVPVEDFLFRYDRGAFWTGRNAFQLFHTPFNRFFRTILDPLMHTRTMYKALHKSNTAQEYFIQDFYIPLSKTNNFIKFTQNHLDIFPIWLCPIKSTATPQYFSPHYLKEDMLIDVGIWGAIPKGVDVKEINQTFENYISKIGGRKMLYAEMFYSEEKFWQIYNKKVYKKLREKYKAADNFPTIWEKTFVKKKYKINKWKILETIFELFNSN